MRQQRYFPSPLAEQVLWLQNFCTKLPTYQSALALSDDDLAAVLADGGYLIYVLGSWQGAVRTFAQSATVALDLIARGEGTPALPVFSPPPPPEGLVAVPNGALTRIFRFIGKLKLGERYTDAIGTDLGITGSGTGPERPVPRFQLQVTRGPAGPAVQLTFFKYGHEAVYVESRRAGGAAEQLCLGVVSPCADERPLLVPGQPEVREYRMRYWDKGDANGEWTDWRQTAVAP